MQVSGTPGIPSASYVGNIPSLTTFTLVDGTGNKLNATANSIEITITFNPPPLDLSGIGFVSNLRTAPGSAQVFLVAQTGDGTMVNGATAGTLSWNVPGARMQNVPAGIYVMGILAVDSTTRRELFPTAPATVTVIAGVSDINTLTGTFHPLPSFFSLRLYNLARHFLEDRRGWLVPPGRRQPIRSTVNPELLRMYRAQQMAGRLLSSPGLPLELHSPLIQLC